MPETVTHWAIFLLLLTPAVFGLAILVSLAVIAIRDIRDAAGGEGPSLPHKGDRWISSNSSDD